MKRIGRRVTTTQVPLIATLEEDRYLVRPPGKTPVPRRGSVLRESLSKVRAFSIPALRERDSLVVECLQRMRFKVVRLTSRCTASPVSLNDVLLWGLEFTVTPPTETIRMADRDSPTYVELSQTPRAKHLFGSSVRFYLAPTDKVAMRGEELQFQFVRAQSVLHVAPVSVPVADVMRAIYRGVEV